MKKEEIKIGSFYHNDNNSSAMSNLRGHCGKVTKRMKDYFYVYGILRQPESYGINDGGSVRVYYTEEGGKFTNRYGEQL